MLPDDGADGLIRHISSARQRVLMTIYLLTDQRIIEALKVARSNGATVRVLVEPRPVGSTNPAPATLDSLLSNGIEAKYSNPYFRLTHQKSVVVDNDVIILTANMTRGGLQYNREFAATIDEPDAVAEVAAIFNADWTRTVYKPTSTYLVWSPVNSRPRMKNLILLASRSIDVYAEELQDDETTQQLVDAHNRNVAVRFLISPPLNGKSVDANAKDLDVLERGGVHVRYLSQPYIHAKVFIVDSNLVFSGSQNLSTSSLEFNRELGVLISDPAAIKRVSSTFQHDWDQAIDR